uniref:Uncharacterized protein n=1 Tax=Xiphophorus couchianus TaxID=32473 RepID=A0A3B5MJU2_9TELE
EQQPKYKDAEEDDLIKPQKLINPILASVQRRALHQDFLSDNNQKNAPIVLYYFFCLCVFVK